MLLRERGLHIRNGDGEKIIEVGKRCKNVSKRTSITSKSRRAPTLLSRELREVRVRRSSYARKIRMATTLSFLEIV